MPLQSGFVNKWRARNIGILYFKMTGGLNASILVMFFELKKWFTGWKWPSIGLPEALIGLLWAILYLPHLRTSPTWYGDETYAFDIARNLAAGKFAWGPIWNTFGGPYQAVYCGVAGLFAGVVGGDIGGARLVSALLGLGTALLLWRVGRRVFGGAVAFSAALFFLAYPQTVIHFRQVYPHDGFAFGVTLAVLMVCRRARWQTDLLSGVGLLAALGSHLLGVYSVMVVFLARLKRPRSWVFLGLPCAIFFGVFFTIILLKFQGWLFEDIFHVGQFYKTDADQHGGQLAFNAWMFFKQDLFHLAGALGIFALLARRRIRRFWPYVVAFLVYAIALLSNRANLGVFYYQAVVLLPFLAVGNAVLLAEFLRALYRLSWIQSRISKMDWKNVVRVIAVALPLVMGAASVYPSITGTLRARNHFWATQSTAEVERVAEWLNERTTADDVVLANTNLAWLLKAKWANLLSFAAWQGFATFMHDYGTPRERFRYSLDTPHIKYAVVGDIDQRWTLAQPHVMETIQKEGLEKWPVVYSEENYLILENPGYTR